MKIWDESADDNTIMEELMNDLASVAADYKSRGYNVILILSKTHGDDLRFSVANTFEDGEEFIDTMVDVTDELIAPYVEDEGDGEPIVMNRTLQ